MAERKLQTHTRPGRALSPYLAYNSIMDTISNLCGLKILAPVAISGLSSIKSTLAVAEIQRAKHKVQDNKIQRIKNYASNYQFNKAQDSFKSMNTVKELVWLSGNFRMAVQPISFN